MKKHLKTYTLSQYVENDLLPEEKASVEAHLENCGDCRRELSFLRTMISVTSRLKDNSVDDLPVFVDETVNKKSSLRKIVPLRKLFYPAATAAAVLLFAGAGLFLELNSGGAVQQKVAVAKKEAVKAKSSAVKTAQESPDLPGVDYEDVVGSSTSIASIVSTLKSNKANVTKVADSYVEAEVAFDDYQRIRDQLGFALVPSGFLSDGVGLAAIGSDDTVSTDISPLKTIKIRIRR
jgi:hypothetical protein